MRRHLKLFRARLRLFGDADDVRNHVAGALDQHGIAGAEIFAADFVQVMQRRVRNRNARELHRLEFRDRGQRTDPADLDLDSFDNRFRLLRFELVSDRPARRSRNLA
jgi:hypothetical protein